MLVQGVNERGHILKHKGRETIDDFDAPSHFFEVLLLDVKLHQGAKGALLVTDGKVGLKAINDVHGDRVVVSERSLNIEK